MVWGTGKDWGVVPDGLSNWFNLDHGFPHTHTKGGVSVDYSIFLQSWYDYEFMTAGAGAHIKPSAARIEALGTAHGFFIEP